MCVSCGPAVLLVHLSKEPLQLRTDLETCLIIGLGVLRGESRNREESGGWSEGVGGGGGGERKK